MVVFVCRYDETSPRLGSEVDATIRYTGSDVAIALKIRIDVKIFAKSFDTNYSSLCKRTT